MAPLRGRKKRKVENQDEDKSLVSGSSSQEDFAEWWGVLSKKITGNPSTSQQVDPFKFNFGMSKNSFSYICSLVKEHMMSRTPFTFTNGDPMSLNDQVALALRRLASGNSLISIGDSFGAHHSTVSQATWRFVEAIEARALHHLRWPSTEEEMSEIKCKFEKIRGLPNCCGAIDTTHITMHLTSSDQEAANWVDRREKHSMILQAVVDPDMKFRSIIAGWPGKMNDSSVLQSSSLFTQCEKHEKLKGPKISLSEAVELSEYIVGDAGYPLLSWLITPYQESRLPETKLDFNKRLLATHFVAHKALAKLKEVWKMMKGELWRPDKHKLPRFILACCILHNIIIDVEEDDDLPSALVHDEGYIPEICKDVDETASLVRDKLSHFFSGR
ncbi:PIF / Ping-Pong family of plant transposase [Perilla frutescens var. hirtella]|nr:PIF / Ping-Pong family of plant transposase [Perilla frutescens var. hirtella]KAH6810465.1 PIF / Ping-Pong family of plant transposase [Perilla frutescens var. frutescens]